ncbi:diacylglycerol kinase epsilon isoform X1 [Maniola jurtina]|uniref:diacylglycerol kinase epsilon isoform X1 n=1 Tax=Maniola jurtina TaxID=191418 RepID=UPI001E68F726|nr:diacylglycerol kinase epsilon isoform X1 [Maniola jurtina]XP_045771704.1 diacylglycerol kinase epsilon isoform X1 [Maniola jurtina]
MDTISNVHFNYYFLIGGLFLGYLVYRIIHSLLGDNTYIQTKYRVRGHTWRSIDCNKSIPYNIYCTVCSKLMLPLVGLFCECCAVSACKKCHRMIDKKFRCKQITWPIDKTFHHLWVNVGTATKDHVDQSEDAEHLNKYFCSWCQRTRVSQENLIDITEPCDFQKYKNIIIPPTNVLVEKGKIVNIKPLPNDNWEPLIIFANRKSGSNRSDEVLSIFRGLLNPLQVIDISATSPERAVRWLPSRCRVLVAGGDGTVAWVLNALHSAPHIKASVGILPMGTGNDLARALGWGASCSDLDAHSIITSLKQADEQILDRWKITIKPRQGRLGRLRSSRVLYAYNYASIGVDAQVALDFHRARSQFLYRYASRYLNYIAYALLGVGRALDDGGCGGLERRLRVQAGTHALQLPPLQALVALNIPSWGAGVDLWSLGSEDEVGDQYMDDGKLEVVGISSSFHIARLQCGLAQPYRFAQASHVWIELDGCCAMQVDGEPWMQGSASIHIEPAGRSTMLRQSSQQHMSVE